MISSASAAALSTFALMVTLTEGGVVAARASSSEEATLWLERSAVLLEKAPFSMNYRVEFTMTSGERTTNVIGTAQMLYSDAEHLRVEIETRVTRCPAALSHECGAAGSLTPGHSQSVSFETRVVHDGAHRWSSSAPAGSTATEVLTVRLEQFPEMNRRQGFDFINTDPVFLWSALRQNVDFELVGIEGGLVVLEGPISETLRRELGPSIAAFGEPAIARLVLDQATAYPELLTMGPDADRGLRISVVGVELLDASELGAEDFLYTPPPGAQVKEYQVNEYPAPGQE